ncbi:MAG: CoA-binding protein [Candidatus Pacebacteria bacterium]|nr:CoA-binding protein [Candidatus Paceibacterota bacterium]
MNLDDLFNAQSIAIVGASSREKTVGNDVVKNLTSQGYQGKIIPINPKIDELYGQKVYHDIKDVDVEIDVVVVAIPAKFVPDVVKVAATKGAKAAVVISAGFKEMGNIKLEEELRDVCRKNNVALIGPNCLGVINAQNKMNASFAALMPEVGNIAFMSQSGALCTAVLDYADKMAIGFSKFVSIGNKADVDEVDLIRYLHTDPETKVVALYAEQLADANQMIDTLIELNKGDNPKPVVILKSGRTEAGAGAIASHTGSLSGGDSAYEALFAQAGIIRANTIEELFNFAQIFCVNKQTVIENVTVITNAGGPGVLTTDEIVKQNFKMAELSEATVKVLKENLPEAASTHNPVDVLGDARADRYRMALEVVKDDPNTDAIIILLTPQSMTEVEETAQVIIEAMDGNDKPLVVSFMGEKSVHQGVEMLQKADIMTTTFPEPAAASLAALSNFTKWSRQPAGEKLHFGDVDYDKVKRIFSDAKANDQTSFPEAAAMEIMRAYNFPLLQSSVASSPEEAAHKCFEMGGDEAKFAMKIVSDDILHKSDVGGVMLNVTTKDAAERYQEMFKTVSEKKPEAKLDGVLLMEMAPQGGIEVILGVSKAPGLGTMIMFGLGGIYVEVLKDVNFAYAPLTRDDAIRMINGLKSSKLFDGVRGQQPVNKESLIEAIGRLSQLVTDFPEIIELDINPLLALPSGAKVLDARVVIE